MFWYMKKTWRDPWPDTEEVKLHYVWGQHGAAPDWERFGQVRTLSTYAERVEGKGRVSPHEGRGETRTVRPLPPGMREKIIKVPEGLSNGQFGLHSDKFLLYHFFEARRNGSVHYSDMYVEEIVSWEVEYTDWHGTVLAVCAHWTINDLDAMAYTPTEDPRFLEWYGEGCEYRSIRVYEYDDLLRWAGGKWKLMQPMPLPRRFRGRLWAPRGAQITQGWHVVHAYRCPERWPLNDSDEIYEGYVTYTAGG
ncbi:MAG: hypothetical protein Kow0099_03690 [Candidatus Abyssubacteria bacterium]